MVTPRIDLVEDVLPLAAIGSAYDGMAAGPAGMGRLWVTGAGRRIPNEPGLVMEIHQLRYFVRLAELGNFTRAAEMCHVAQPSLSQQIAKLERELGQPLFERLGRSVQLTEAGRQFQTRAVQILRLLDDTKAQLVDSPDQGKIVVGAIPTIAPYWLPRLLVRVAQAMPGLQIEVVEETTANLLKRIADGSVDLAILAVPVQAEQFFCESLFDEELQVVLPATHRLAVHSRLRLEMIQNEPFILLNETHCLTDNALTFCARHQWMPLVTAEIHQLLTVQELVRLGVGISLIPQMAATLDSHPGRIYRTLGDEPPKRSVGMGWNTMRFQTKRFQRLVNWLRQERERGELANWLTDPREG
ncbi:LysR family transcriptional regulator [Tuwongella immobilis]|nr:LysR family transcriptional regulator [Tuwongella immobilis]